VDGKSWTVDLKNGNGSVKQGKAEGKPDCTITIKGEDLVAMATGKLNGQTAFMQGKLKIGGNMAFAMKLGQIFETKTAGGAGGAAASSPSASTSTLVVSHKETQVIYYKTHKTGSTTVGNMLWRFGAQHGLKLHKPSGHYLDIRSDVARRVVVPPCDITLYHHRPTQFEAMMKYYRSFIPKGKFLSILREPVRRYLSHYHFYYEIQRTTFERFLKLGEPRNVQSRDFGIYNQAAMDSFMKTAYSEFFILITELYDETLLLLKNAMNWSLQDILYVKLNDGCSTGLRDYDGMAMRCVPKYKDLTKSYLDTMKRNNRLDVQFYARALNDTKAKLAAQPKSFWDELKTFKKMKADLENLCTGANKTIPAGCNSFLMIDLEYEAAISEEGVALNYTPLNLQFSV